MTSWGTDDEFEAAQCSRFGFRDRVVSSEITQLYIGKKVPDDLGEKGAISPVRYSPGSQFRNGTGLHIVVDFHT